MISDPMTSVKNLVVMRISHRRFERKMLQNERCSCTFFHETAPKTTRYNLKNNGNKLFVRKHRGEDAKTACHYNSAKPWNGLPLKQAINQSYNLLSPSLYLNLFIHLIY